MSITYERGEWGIGTDVFLLSTIEGQGIITWHPTVKKETHTHTRRYPFFAVADRIVHKGHLLVQLGGLLYLTLFWKSLASL